LGLEELGAVFFKSHCCFGIEMCSPRAVPEMCPRTHVSPPKRKHKIVDSSETKTRNGGLLEIENAKLEE